MIVGRRALAPFQIVGRALIIAGLALAFAPSAFVQFTDNYLARVHQADVNRWIRTYETKGQTPRDSVAVIDPAGEGYLLEIPKIGLRAVVHELEPDVLSGRNTPILKRYGIGQIPYTSNLQNVSPGAGGTAAITGHRTTSGAPFRHIDQLARGDMIILSKRAIKQQWTILYSLTVPPYQVSAIRSFPGVRRLVILACDPPFSARQRLIVYAALLQHASKAKQKSLNRTL